MLTPTALLSRRTAAIDVSGIRRVFELGAKLADPINLSIGQPDFPVADVIKDAAISAIRDDRNGYTLTQGDAALLERLGRHLRADVGWDAPSDETGLIVTSGTSGAIMVAFLALLDPGDEVVIPDPWFVVYPALATMAEAVAVPCATYPDFRMTAARVEPLLTERTKIVLVNSPGNPSGVVLSDAEMRDLAALCVERGVVLLSDEIYDEFTFSDARDAGRCPSPARHTRDMLLVRGFGKTYGCTGWRLGYAAGPAPIVREMTKMQQYSFVCAPSMAQGAMIAALDTDMSTQIAAYEGKRDRVVAALGDVARIVHPGGAFYVFVEVPERLGMTASQLVERAIERNVLVIPGSVFSSRDTHFRISFAVPDAKLDQGLAVLRELLAG